MLMKQRSEIEDAALELGYRPSTIRKWMSRRAVPLKAQIDLFGQPVSVKEFIPRTSLSDMAKAFACL